MSKETETKAASDGGPGLPERRAYRDMQRLGQPLAHVASFMCPVTESWCELGACRRGFCLLEKQEEANAETAYARSKSAQWQRDWEAANRARDWDACLALLGLGPEKTK